MAKDLRQFYGDGGVPFRVEGGIDDPAIAWRSQRERVRAWLSSVPDADWSSPTRCELWDTTLLVRHLASGSQFLGYTLHQAVRGTCTDLLRDFDSHQTVQAAAAMLGDMTPGDARAALTSMDASVDAELGECAGLGWSVMAEAPPGQLASHLAVSHFVFDSWVHEYDLMLPRGERPVIDRLEAEVTVRYLIGLAVIATGARTPLELRLTEPDLHIGVGETAGIVEVAVGAARPDGLPIEGRAIDFVDRATGRDGGPVHGDDRALAVLDEFGRLLAD